MMPPERRDEDHPFGPFSTSTRSRLYRSQIFDVIAHAIHKKSPVDWLLVTIESALPSLVPW
jgi:hypothetical protein